MEQLTEDMQKSLDAFQRRCEMFHVKLSKTQINQLLSYYQLLIETNKVMNLTAITEFEDVLTKHFLDSLAMTEYIDMASIENLIDVGTGAGFPGIPLKIVFPHLHVTLMDSLNKRIHFLNTVIERLKLTGIESIHARAEDLARNDTYREQYDIAVSRAVSNLSTLTEYCLPFVKVHGRMISYKSGDVMEEVGGAIHAVTLLGGKVQHIHCYSLPETEIERSLVKIMKIKTTPKKYPRKAGTPQKEPL